MSDVVVVVVIDGIGLRRLQLENAVAKQIWRPHRRDQRVVMRSTGHKIDCICKRSPAGLTRSVQTTGPSR